MEIDLLPEKVEQGTPRHRRYPVLTLVGRKVTVGAEMRVGRMMDH